MCINLYGNKNVANYKTCIIHLLCASNIHPMEPPATAQPHSLPKMSHEWWWFCFGHPPSSDVMGKRCTGRLELLVTSSPVLQWIGSQKKRRRHQFQLVETTLALVKGTRATSQWDSQRILLCWTPAQKEPWCSCAQLPGMLVWLDLCSPSTGFSHTLPMILPKEKCSSIWLA